MLFFTSQEKTAGNVRNVSKTFIGLKLLTEVGLEFGAGDTCDFGGVKERQGWGLAVGWVTDHAGPHYILPIASVRNNRSIVVLCAALKKQIVYHLSSTRSALQKERQVGRSH